MTKRRAIPKDPHTQFNGMAELSASFENLLRNDENAYQAAINLAVVDRMPERGLHGNITLIALWNGHELPEAAIPEVQNFLRAHNVTTLILSGGRIFEEWPKTQTEAGLFHKRLKRDFSIEAVVKKDHQALHTHAQFVNILKKFRRDLEASDHIVIMCHHLQTNRAVMDARNVFCGSGFMSAETFEAKVHIQGFDAQKPALDWTEPRKLAETLSRFVVYTEKGDLTPLPQERALIEELRRRACRI